MKSAYCRMEKWELMDLCDIVTPIFYSQPTLLDLDVPVHIVGDIHGEWGLISAYASFKYFKSRKWQFVTKLNTLCARASHFYFVIKHRLICVNKDSFENKTSLLCLAFLFHLGINHKILSMGRPPMRLCVSLINLLPPISHVILQTCLFYLLNHCRRTGIFRI